MTTEKQIRSFENRCRGLKKKLGELSTLCDVEVCMVCTHPSSSQLHIWPEDPSKAEQTISKYRMMKSGEKKKKVQLHPVDINGSGQKKEVPALDEHLNFLRKDGLKKGVPVLDQHLNFSGNDHDGKTKEEIYLESLPYDKLKEFMSALNGKIEQVKQEIAVKKMQAELMELIYGDTSSPTMVENENHVASYSSTSSSYDHQKMMGPAPGMQEMVMYRMPQNQQIATVPDSMENMLWMPMPMPQNHMAAAPAMQEMEYSMPQNHLAANPSMQEMMSRMPPQPHLRAIPSMQNIMWMPQNQQIATVPDSMENMLWMPMPQNHMAAAPAVQEMEYSMPQNHLAANPSMREMMSRMPPQPHLRAIPSMQNIMWMPQNQLTSIPAMQELNSINPTCMQEEAWISTQDNNNLAAINPVMPEMILMSQSHQHVTYSNNSSQYARDVHAFSF